MNKDSIKKLLGKQKGATLIELLLYLFLLTLIATIATDIFISSSEASLESNSKFFIQQEAGHIIDRLSYDVRRASSITTPSLYGEPGSTTLQLEFTLGYSPVETHTYNFNSSSNSIEYQGTVGNSIQPANLNSNQTKVSNLKFIRLGSATGKPTIKVSFDLEGVKPTKQGIDKQSFETIVGLR